MRHCLLLLGLLLTPPALAHEGAAARLSELDAALALTPDAPDLLLERADERRRAGDLTGAAEDVSRAESQGASVESVLLQRARLRQADGALDEALALLRGARALPLVELRAEVTQTLDASASCADRLTVLAAHPTARRAAAAAGVCAEPARLAAALAEAEAALGLVPQVRRLRIEALLASGEDATSPGRELVDRFPSSDAHLLLARAFTAAGRHDEAQSARSDAVQAAEDRLARRGTPLHRLDLAEALLEAGRRRDARAQLERVLADAPDLPGAQRLAALLAGECP